MKQISALNFLFAVVFMAGCSARPENPDRLYFFEDEDRAIVVPVRINDSITASALFDTGAPFGMLQLDSTFCATHPLAVWSDSNMVWNGTGYMTGWAKEDEPKVNETSYVAPLTVNMCGVNMEFDRFYTVDGSNRIGRFDVCFSFSAKDTIHVWELNFKYNYMEAHSAGDFTMPVDCHVLPLVKAGGYDMYVRFPVEVICADGATITIDQTYLIDTGMLSDLVLLESAEEYGFFRKRGDAVLLNHWNNRRYNVDAMVFDGVKLDGMRVYLNDGSFMLNDGEAKGIIGLNFMKRFNVFFDLSKMEIGFQPITGFKRTVNLDFTRLYITQEVTPEGNGLVAEVLDIPGNPYREAGMMAGDIVVAINGIELKNGTAEDFKKIRRSKTRELDIIRDGAPMKLVVRFDELGE